MLEPGGEGVSETMLVFDVDYFPLQVDSYVVKSKPNAGRLLLVVHIPYKPRSMDPIAGKGAAPCDRKIVKKRPFRDQ